MRIRIHWSRSGRLWTIFLIALSLRMLFIIPKGNSIAVPYRDQNTYYALGRAIVDDGFLGPPTNHEVGPYYEYRLNNPPPLGKIPEIRQRMIERWDADKHYYGVMKWGAPSSFFEPLYPLYSAACYWIFGDRFFFWRALLAIISAATCLLVFGIGRRLFSEGVGYIAAMICALYPYFIFYTVFLMSETFLIFFLALSVYCFVRLREEPVIRWGVFFGIALGLTFLTRSIVLGLIPVFLFLLIIEKPRELLIPSLVSVVLFAVTIFPWVIRNYKLHGEFVLLSTRGGYNIWLRNNPYFYEDELALLGVKVPQDILDSIKYREYLDYPEFSPEQGEIERNRILTSEGMKYVRANPKLFTYFCWVRFKSIIGFQGVLAQGLVYKLVGILTFGILFPLGIIAFFVNIKRWRETLPLMLTFCYFVGVYSLTHDGIRYRLPVDPYIIILASVLLASGISFVNKKLYRLWALGF